jgi:hypothetical protein
MLRIAISAALCAAAGCAHDAPARSATAAGWRETSTVQATPSDPRRAAYVMLDATRARCELALEHLADEAEDASTQRRAERVIASVLTAGSGASVSPTVSCTPASGRATSPQDCASSSGPGVFSRSPGEDAAAERIAETNALAEDVAERLERLHEILEDETFDDEQARDFNARLDALDRRCGLPG